MWLVMRLTMGAGNVVRGVAGDGAEMRLGIWIEITMGLELRWD